MEYKASIYATKYFGHVLTVIFLLSVPFLFASRQYIATGLLVGMVAIVLIRLHTRKMSFNDHIFQYDGWFSSIEISYSDILKVENSEAIGYPTDRLHGPHEYLITTNQGKRWVSLIWFDGAASKQFHELIIKHKKLNA